jgi:microcin C transport system substrate-binding protein
MRFLLAFTFALFFSCAAFAGGETFDFKPSASLHGQPKYESDFTNFDYANPSAPKGGELRLAASGTFDNLNPFILNGMAASGSDMAFETLMHSSLDEPFSQYGWIAEGVAIAQDKSWVAYKLRPNARFNNGKPITPDDVIFSFETLRDKGHPFYRSYYKDVTKAERLGNSIVKFTFAAKGNNELPLIMGQLPVLEKNFWIGKNFASTTLNPIVGSGPYEIDKVEPGRSIVYKRAPNWWAKDLPINKGRYNFDTIRYDYYRDQTVTTEAFLSGRYDFRLENIAKYWATLYNIPAVTSGKIVKEEIKNELPTGMQGFVFNTRRDIFKDPRVRQALAYAFDFEWSNKNVAYNSYERSRSYFSNSELEAKGTPSGDELKILEAYRGKIPDEVFTEPYNPPKTDGSGDLRDNLLKASDLLRQAGWIPVNGKLMNNKKEEFKFEIVDSSPAFERWIQPFLRNLERLGIQATFRVVDSAQYQNLVDNLNFDMTIYVYATSLSPGNELRDMFGSSKASQPGTRNLAGIHDPVVDDLIDKIIHVSSREELVTLSHALDRVLVWGHYFIPHWHAGTWRIAYWNMFGHPEITPKYGLGFPESWWIDREKLSKIEPSLKRNR